MGDGEGDIEGLAEGGEASRGEELVEGEGEGDEVVGVGMRRCDHEAGLGNWEWERENPRRRGGGWAAGRERRGRGEQRRVWKLGRDFRWVMAGFWLICLLFLDER